MATSETTNLQLVKYGAGTDNFIRTDYNGNLDKIDTFAGNTNEAISNKPDYATEMPMSSSDATKVSEAIATLDTKIPVLERKTVTGIANNSGALSLGFSTGAYEVLSCYISGASSARLETQKYNNTWFAVGLAANTQYTVIAVTWLFVT